MFIGFDKFDMPEKPVLTLAFPGGREIGQLGAYEELVYEPALNSYSILSFKYPYYFEDGEVSNLYDDVRVHMLIKAGGLGEFIIRNCEQVNDGVVKYLEVSAESAESELCRRKSGVVKGTYTFEELMNTVIETIPDWSLGELDTDLLGKSRTFEDENTTTLYDFLMNEVSETYGCIFKFDSINRTISAYVPENAISDSDIFIGYNSFLRSENFKENSDNITTVMSCYGGDGVTIAPANPMGTTYLYNFNHFKPMMSSELRRDIGRWENLFEAKKTDYAALVSQIQEQNELIVAAQTELKDLDTKLKELEDTQATKITTGETTGTEWDNLISDIVTKKNEITDKEAKIADLEADKEELLDAQKEINDSLAIVPADITDLSNTTWVFDTQFAPMYDKIVDTFNVNFSANNNEYTSLKTKLCWDIDNDKLITYNDAGQLLRITFFGPIDLETQDCDQNGRVTADDAIWLNDYFPNYNPDSEDTVLYYGNTVVYNSQTNMDGTPRAGWKNENYRTIHISDGDDVTNPELIKWLRRTAVQVDAAVTKFEIPTEEYLELEHFKFESTHQDDRFIVTDKMDIKERLDIETQLYDECVSLMNQVSAPTYDITADAVNFLFCKELEPYFETIYDSSKSESIKQLIGTKFNLEVADDEWIEAVLLKMHINFEDPTDFSLEFSNKYRLNDALWTYADLIGETVSSNGNISFDYSALKTWETDRNDLLDFANGSLDATRNKLVNDPDKQTFVVDGTGMRASNESNNRGIWLTSDTLAFSDDNFSTVKTAIGAISVAGQINPVYGVNAEVLIGKAILGNNLTIENSGETFTMNGDGLTVENSKNIINLDPNNGILIKKKTTSPAEKIFEVDSNGDLIIKGNITATSGNIGGFTVTNNEIKSSNGNISLKSDGTGKIGMITIGTSSTTFDGNIYAENILYGDTGGYLNGGAIEGGTITANEIAEKTILPSNIVMDSSGSTTGLKPTLKSYFDTIYATEATVDTLIANSAYLKWIQGEPTYDGRHYLVTCNGTLETTVNLTADGSIFADDEVYAGYLNSEGASKEALKVKGYSNFYGTVYTDGYAIISEGGTISTGASSSADTGGGLINTAGGNIALHGGKISTCGGLAFGQNADFNIPASCRVGLPSSTTTSLSSYSLYVSGGYVRATAL